jgi:hypothetical protein
MVQAEVVDDALHPVHWTCVHRAEQREIKSLLFDMIDLIDAAERANRNEHIRIPYRG